MDNDAESARQAIRSLVADTNINEETLLATDFLNHFNEVIMLIELVPDFPEYLEEARNWQPRTYVEHFQASIFSDRELAVRAYENAPSVYRLPFEATIAQINSLLADCLSDIEGRRKTENSAQLRHSVDTWTHDIRLLMDRASAIINGDFGKNEAAPSATFDRDDIDALFEPTGKPSGR